MEDLPTLYSLTEAARRLDPSEKLLTAASIRTEIDRGRLAATRIAGKLFVAHDDLVAFVHAAREVRTPTPVPDMAIIRRQVAAMAAAPAPPSGGVDDPHVKAILGALKKVKRPRP